MFHTLKAKLILTNLSLVLALALFGSLVTYGIYSRAEKRLLMTGYNTASMEAVKNVNQYFRNVDSLFKLCFGSESFRELVLGFPEIAPYETHRAVQRAFNGYFSLPIPIKSIHFEDTSGNHYRSGSYELTPQQLHTIRMRMNNVETLWILGSDISPDLDNLVIMAKRIDYTDSAYNLYTLGYGYIAIDESALVSQVNSYGELTPNRLYFYDVASKSMIFSPSNPVVDAQFLNTMQSENTLSSQYEKNQKHYFVSMRPLEVEGWNIVYVGEVSEQLLQRLSIAGMLALVIAVSTVCVVVLTVLLNSRITSPVKEIIATIRSISTGNFYKKAEIKTHDEFADIANNLNTMLDEIHALSSRIVLTQRDLYEKELEWKDLGLSVLNNQINSHFFYNILTAMRGMVAKGQNDTAVELIQRVVTYLRYATENTRVYALFDELRYLENYVDMHRLRSDMNFKLIVECSPEYNEFKLYKFLLQPFIENSIVHAFKDKHTNCVVVVRVSRRGENLRIAVYDNGDGFDVLRMEKSKSVGIENVQKRLKLYYGGEARLQIRSVLKKGTLAVLTLPGLKEVDTC